MASVTGFLLTRHWRGVPDGVELVFWTHSTAGPLRLVFRGQRAVCFTPAHTALDPADLPGLRLERKRLRLRALDSWPVDGLYLPHQRDLGRLRARHRGGHTALRVGHQTPRPLPHGALHDGTLGGAG